MNKFGIGSLINYDLVDQVGEGTYGYVYKATDRRSGETVALKRLILHRESAGFPLCSVREIKFLKKLQHKNIVKLRDVVTSKGCEHKELPIKAEFQRADAAKAQAAEQAAEEDGYDILKLCGNLYFVFEFVEHDLGGLIDAKYKFSTREIKCIMKQLFEVLDYLQDVKVVHRDIKTSNILLSSRHHVKLADFGLARSLQSHDGRELRVDLSNNVITLWYRPPELLLGAVRYASAVDVWSMGCVLAELELGRPLFPGKTETEQIEMIFRTIGTPDESTWPGLSALSNTDALLGNLPKYASTLQYNYSGKIPEPSMNLLERILVADPVKRSSAKIALTNVFFHSAPYPPNDPADLEPLAVSEGISYHEYKTKVTRKQKEEEAAAVGTTGAAAILSEQRKSTDPVVASLSNGVPPPPPRPPVFVSPKAGALPTAGLPPLSFPPPPTVAFPSSVPPASGTVPYPLPGAPPAPPVPPAPRPYYPSQPTISNGIPSVANVPGVAGVLPLAPSLAPSQYPSSTTYGTYNSHNHGQNIPSSSSSMNHSAGYSSHQNRQYPMNSSAGIQFQHGNNRKRDGMGSNSHRASSHNGSKEPQSDNEHRMPTSASTGGHPPSQHNLNHSHHQSYPPPQSHYHQNLQQPSSQPPTQLPQYGYGTQHNPQSAGRKRPFDNQNSGGENNIYYGRGGGNGRW